ncbi:MAG: hypothetical protein CL693_10770 [Cellvibrionaceae bacterium]|nr:hypothetical protein [Cellvibrionaceae bacterium]|tara:strand:- start:17410 stop:17637 length:228 start_codon:yes stop_codon:yes gene_type:complete
MQATIVYGFDSAQVASRFLNRVRASDFRGVKASFRQGGTQVRIVYPLAELDGYDSTCADLDELASALDGIEISHQ